jgi:hypothetical protein
MRPILIVLLVILICGTFALSRAGDSTGVSSALVVRSQLQSIADEVVDQAKFDTKGRVSIWVEGEGPRSLAENAFIETLQKRSYTSGLGMETASGQTIHVFLLGTDIKVRELDAKYSERNINTTLEVRTMSGTEREIRLLGIFHRETKDTAQVFPSVQLPAGLKDEETGVMQKLFTPLIIISGSILIVYLLFTVRS